MAVTYRLKSFLKIVLKRPWSALRRIPRRLLLMAARVVYRFLPFGNIERDILYPPEACCSSTAEWVSKIGRSMGSDFRQVDLEYTAKNALPKTIHEHVRHQLSMDQAYACPDTFVARIPGGRVFGDGLIIAPDNQLLADVSIDFSVTPESKLANIRRDWAYYPIANIDGTVAVLSTAGAMLYYHWLFQLLPRFELIRRSGIDLSRIDYFLVNSNKKRFQRESLEALGIAHKIIDSSAVGSVRASTLVVPSVPLWGGCFAPWMCEFLKSTFPPTTGSKGGLPSRRLYINRRTAGYRRVLNEGGVIDLLKQFGFEQADFEVLSIQQQATVMAASEAVIAPHGGGLSNLVFCRPGTKVIEIFSPELVAGYFWKLSNQLGLDYYYVLGKGLSAAREPNYAQTWNARTDIEIDLDCLRSTLELADIHPLQRSQAN
jgi:capsular polysaccharide biosynthesis protein